ncbi:hypothetical protein SUGI_0295610 [Cryptomeria japonica]|nr:hypothetical protein SUGI_0295610 [Cryptomeria japonica]
MVRWSTEEGSQIRKVLSFEEFKLSPDLDARLHQEDEDGHINFVEKSIQEMVSLIKDGDSSLSRSRESVEKDLAGILDGNASRDVVDVCGRVLLQEFKASINSHSFTTLGHLFKLIQHCNRGVLEAAFKAFCEDAEFMEYVKNKSCYSSIDDLILWVDMILWFMKATGEGKIIISRASRVSLLTTCLPIIGTFNYHSSLGYKFEELDKAVLKVVESLPQVDQKRICLLWAEVYRLNKIDIATPFTMSKYLQHVHSESAAK